MIKMEGAGQPFNGDIHMQDAFIKLRDKYGIKRVIETGTYHGDTTEWLALNFDHVRTIEYDRTNMNIASRKLKSQINVEQFQGDSSRDLTRMMLNFTDKLLIFLDAHWYKNPVIDELKQIEQAGIQPVLVIHDFFNPDDPTMGFDEYPAQGIRYEYSWIEPMLLRIYPDGFKYHFNKKATGARRGCIFVVPNATK